MKNIIVANYRDSKTGSAKRYPKESLEMELRAQIENSIELGWSPKDLWVVTNFSFSFMGINAFTLPLNEKCLTGSKSFVMRELFNAGMMTENVWIHDLDAWQCVPFEWPLDGSHKVGIANYSRPKYNGGSVFYTPDSREIVEAICKKIEDTEDIREEPAITSILKNDFANDTMEVDYGFNLGCSGFKERYNRSDKPIKVVHFHPTNRIAWDTHTRNRNNIDSSAVIPTRLKDLFLRYWGDSIKQYTYEDTPNGGDPLKVRNDWSGTRYEKTTPGAPVIIEGDDGEKIAIFDVDPIEPAKVAIVQEKITNLGLFDYFSQFNPGDFTQEILANLIYNKVGLSLNVRKLGIDDTVVNDCWGGVQAKQYPEEFAGLLMFMYHHLDEIKTYYEIGVERGGTFFTVDSFMRVVNPNFEGSLGVDVDNKIMTKHKMTEYNEKFPTTHFRNISSLDTQFEEGASVDFVLIDGDHGYKGVKNDWQIVAPFAKFIAFHDIHLEGSGVKAFWEEIHPQYEESVEILNTDPRFPNPIGIGIIWGEME